MTERGIDYREPVPVPDLPSVWLAFAAERYAAADTAFWKTKSLLGPDPAPGQADHLAQLGGERMAAYYSLIAWAETCEDERKKQREGNS